MHPIYIENYVNTAIEPQLINNAIRAEHGVQITKSQFEGAAAFRRGTSIGPDVSAGAFLGMNEYSFMARTKIGRYCSIGARNAINPFQHPTDWLSIHEFQYHIRAFSWVGGYDDFVKVPWDRTPGAKARVTIGNDVWTGHNVNIMGNVTIEDGAVIAAGAVVTKDVPPFAIVGGVPAKLIRYRFPDTVIERLLAVRWWDLPYESLSGLPFDRIEACLDQIEGIRARPDGGAVT